MVVENTYHTQRQHQGYLEPQNCARRHRRPEGRVNALGRQQGASRHRDAASPASSASTRQHVLVHHTYIGGDFGGKATPVLLPICYYLAEGTGRPVRMVNDYLEELLAGNPRHADADPLRTGVKTRRHDHGPPRAVLRQQRRLRGLQARRHDLRAGAGGRALPPSPTPASRRRTSTRTRSPAATCAAPANRRPSSPSSRTSTSCAHAIGMDPVDFRMKNLVGEGDEAAFGVTFEHVRANETLQAAVDAAGYRAPKPPNVGRGVAIGERPAGGGIGNARDHLQPGRQRQSSARRSSTRAPAPTRS